MKIIQDFCIVHKPLTAARKSELEGILRRSCRTLEIHHREAKSKGYAGNRRLFFAELMRGGCSSIPKEDVALIGRIKDIEYEILCAHAKLISKISSGMSDDSFCFEDAQSAAMEGFLMAVCYFTKENVKFSTFLSCCMERRIIETKAYATNPMGIPGKIVKLRRRLKKAMSSGESLDSAVSKMNLSEKTERMLVASLPELHNASGIGVAEDKFVVVNDSDPAESPKLPTDMSDLEREVLEEFLKFGDKMNLSEVARRLKNPKTGKNYSRMAMSLAWKRVKGKMSSAYGRVA